VKFEVKALLVLIDGIHRRDGVIDFLLVSVVFEWKGLGLHRRPWKVRTFVYLECSFHRLGGMNMPHRSDWVGSRWRG